MPIVDLKTGMVYDTANDNNGPLLFIPYGLIEEGEKKSILMKKWNPLTRGTSVSMPDLPVLQVWAGKLLIFWNGDWKVYAGTVL